MPKQSKKNVKNTKTEVAPENAATGLHWYHIAATVVVLGLAFFAITRIFAHFDISLFGSKYSIRYWSGCSSTIAGPVEVSDIKYSYAGIQEGDLIGTKGRTDDLAEAFLEIVKLGEGKVTIKTRNHRTNEWKESEIKYGSENTITTDDIVDCSPVIDFTINR